MVEVVGGCWRLLEVVGGCWRCYPHGVSTASTVLQISPNISMHGGTKVLLGISPLIGVVARNIRRINTI
jgi:hypothetical protein